VHDGPGDADGLDVYDVNQPSAPVVRFGASVTASDPIALAVPHNASDRALVVDGSFGHVVLLDFTTGAVADVSPGANVNAAAGLAMTPDDDRVVFATSTGIVVQSLVDGGPPAVVIAAAKISKIGDVSSTHLMFVTTEPCPTCSPPGTVDHLHLARLDGTDTHDLGPGGNDKSFTDDDAYAVFRLDDGPALVVGSTLKQHVGSLHAVKLDDPSDAQTLGANVFKVAVSSSQHVVFLDADGLLSEADLLRGNAAHAKVRPLAQKVEHFKLVHDGLGQAASRVVFSTADGVFIKDL
jgi:hypothetical protein